MIKKFSGVIVFSFLFSLFFTNIILFSVNLPVQDDWNTIFHISNLEADIIDFIFIKENNHLIIISRLIFYINYFLFNLNYSFTDYLNFLILCFTFNKFRIYLRVSDNLNLIILSSIFFSGKLIPTITQSFNVVWLLSLLFFVFFLENYDSKNKKVCFKVLFILFLSVLNFSLYYCLIGYLILNLIFSNNRLTNFLYLIFLLLSIIFLNLISNIFLSDYNLLTSNSVNAKNLFHNFNLYSFFYTSISCISSIYFPIIKSITVFSFFFGFFQLCIILFFYIRNFTFDKKSFSRFVNENPMIIFGLFGSFLIGLFRTYDSLEARFVIISLIFQIGFFKIYFQYTKKKIIPSICIILIILSGYFSPNLGVYWQIMMFDKYNNVKECLYTERTNLNKCENIIYTQVFNNGTWYSKDKFDKSLNLLIDKNKSIFNEKHIGN